MELASWRHAPEREISCRECMETKTILSGGKVDCTKCPPNGYVHPILENIEILELIGEYGSCLTDGMGGINLSNLNIILDSYNTKERDVIMKKIIMYMSYARSTQNQNQGSKNE